MHPRQATAATPMRSRSLPGGGSSDPTVPRRIGNGALVFLMNRGYRTAFSDLCHEVPSYERDRRHGESHLKTWRDGRRVLRAIVRERLRAPARTAEIRPARPAAAPGTVRKP